MTLTASAVATGLLSRQERTELGKKLVQTAALCRSRLGMWLQSELETRPQVGADHFNPDADGGVDSKLVTLVHDFISTAQDAIRALTPAAAVDAVSSLPRTTPNAGIDKTTASTTLPDRSVITRRLPELPSSSGKPVRMQRNRDEDSDSSCSANHQQHAASHRRKVESLSSQNATTQARRSRQSGREHVVDAVDAVDSSPLSNRQVQQRTNTADMSGLRSKKKLVLNNRGGIDGKTLGGGKLKADSPATLFLSGFAELSLARHQWELGRFVCNAIDLLGEDGRTLRVDSVFAGGREEERHAKAVDRRELAALMNTTYASISFHQEESLVGAVERAVLEMRLCLQYEQ